MIPEERKDIMADKKKTKKTEAEVPVTEEQTADTAAEQTPDGAEAEAKSPDETEKLKKELAEANDKWLRTMAEYENFRKRSQKEKEAIYADSKSDIAAKFLPVLDNFERAAASAEDFEGYKKGIEMIVKQLLDVFSAMGIESYGEKGEVFDPNIHNGVMHIDDGELPENSIAEVFMKGYKLGEKVIRHATVKVAN